MQTVPLSSIKIPEVRQRRAFDEKKLVDLAESIERLGLMHPIVVRSNGEANILVAGERRLRAIQELWAQGATYKCGAITVPEGWIPIVHMGDLGPIEAMDAELSENIIREDLTWQERCEALAALHKLRLALNPAHKVADLAEEVTGRRDGRYQGDIRDQLIVAKHLDNPIVAGAKDAKEAFKLLKKAEELQSNAELAITVGRTYGKHLHKVLQGDAIQWLAEMPESSFNCIITDPPYGIDADQFGDGAGKYIAIDHKYKDSEDAFRSLLTAVAPLVSRVARPIASLYVCCDLDQFSWLRALFRENGFYVFRTPLINVKQGSGRVPLPDKGPRRQYETILYGFRGENFRVNAIYSDVLQTVGDEQLGHGAQKPVDLYRQLLSRTTRPGDSVLDCFAGSGTLFPAAHSLKLIATGIEENPAYFGMCVKRIEELE